MTIKEALEQLRAKQPNQFTDKQLIAFLSVLDGQVFEFLQGHEDCTEEFSGYGEDIALDTVLLAKAPYDEMYGYFLASKVDYMLDEIDRYNVSASLFNEVLERYRRYIRRTRMPLQKASITWVGL